MTYNEINEYIDFAYKVFDYMNGRINKVNTGVVLNICSLQTDTVPLAYMDRNSVLYLFIYNILDRIDGDDKIRENILFTIIHELYHADQIKSIIDYNNNKRYANKIECDVDYMAILYILNNFETIKNVFNVTFDKDMLYSIIGHINGAIQYRRTTLFDLYVETIESIFSNIKYDSVSNILYNETDVILSINNKECCIKKGGVLNNNVEDMMSLIREEYIYCGVSEHNTVLARDGDSGEFIFRSDTKKANVIELLK